MSTAIFLFLLNVAVVVLLLSLMAEVVSHFLRKRHVRVRLGVQMSILMLVLLTPLTILASVMLDLNPTGLLRFSLKDPVEGAVVGSSAAVTTPRVSEEVDVALVSTAKVAGHVSTDLHQEGLGPGKNRVPVLSHEVYQAAAPLENRGFQGIQVPALVLFTAWVVGAVFLLLRQVFSHCKLASLRRVLVTATSPGLIDSVVRASEKLELGRVPGVYTSKAIAVPFVFGFRAPAVVLPAACLETMTRVELDAIVLHELAHLKRHDHWVALFENCARSVFWWNPLVHRLAGRMGNLREEVCDLYAVGGEISPSRYAKTLLAIAEGALFPEIRVPAAANQLLKSSPSQLEGRIGTLLALRGSSSRGLKKSGLETLVISHLSLAVGIGIIMCLSLQAKVDTSGADGLEGGDGLSGAPKKLAKVSLFNGHDLSGWTVYSGDTGYLNPMDPRQQDSWRVSERQIECLGGGPGKELRTNASYQNYTLTFSYRLPHGFGDSGVGVMLSPQAEEYEAKQMLRQKFPNVRTYICEYVEPPYMEVQLNPREVGDLCLIGGIEARAEGKFLQKDRFVVAPRTVTGAINQWNQLKLTVVDGALTVELNGKVINQAVAAYRGPGKIVLRNEGKPVHFKDLVLTPLD